MKTGESKFRLLGVCLVVWILLVSCLPALGQPDQATACMKSENGPGGNRVGGVRMLGGPYQHRVLSAFSPDGLTWTCGPGGRLEQASVPGAVADGDHIVLYHVGADRGPGQPESTGCGISSDGLHFDRPPFAIKGLPTRKAVDLCVPRNPEGKFWLYYLASGSPGDPAADERPHEIHLGLPDDGIHFYDVGLVSRRWHGRQTLGPFLWLTGQAARMLCKEIPFTAQMPKRQ